MCFSFKRLSPRSNVQGIMECTFLPNKVLSHTFKYISEVSLGTIPNNSNNQ